MEYRLTEVLGVAAETVTLHGRTFPVPSVIEGDDGFRWMLLGGWESISPGYWARAVAMGVVGLAAPQGSQWGVITSERFLDEAKQSQGHFHLTRGWVLMEEPKYAALFAGRSDSKPDQVTGFAHLHLHSEFSPLDGASKIPEAVDIVVADGQPAMGLTDHGNCSGHPLLQRECDKAGITPVFGMEAYFVDDRFRRPRSWYRWPDSGNVVTPEQYERMDAATRKTLLRESDAKEVRDYYHLVLLAQTQQGLKNLWAMSTESFRDGAYYYPKLDWDTLSRHAEGVVATAACLHGPVARPWLAGDEDRARANLSRLMEIFPDRFYLELHTNGLAEQIQVNQASVELSQTYGVPLLAVTDSHYLREGDYLQHQAWVAVQTDSDVQDEGDLFATDMGLYIKTEAEVRESLNYLDPQVVDESVHNTVRIAQGCDARIENRTVFPVFSRRREGETEEEVRQRDVERLLDLCLSNWHLTVGPGKPPQEHYFARFEGQEFPLIVDKGFCGYFLQVADYVRKMKDQKVLVGPSRGSGGGSLVAYLSGITGVDPVQEDLAFERFMTEGRKALPDFDVDFPQSKRHLVQDYITSRYGESHVARVGTHIRTQNKGIIKDLFRALKSTLPEDTWKAQAEISDLIGEAEAGTAGIGLTWEELWAQQGEALEPYRQRFPQVFDLAEGLVGMLKTYGKHPAGLIVADEDLTGALPLRRGEVPKDASHDEVEKQMITQFAMTDLEAMGYIKFDILTLRTLDTIQECVDLIEQRRGYWIDPYTWKEEYLDPQVWETLADGHTLGVFQVETSAGARMCRQVRPSTMAEFADVLTLVRPGPKRSGLTDLYLERRAGREPVSFPDPRLEQVLAPTYGAILYQEQVMQTCMILAGYDSTKADEVRKILGKKKVSLTVQAGREFVDGCAANGMDRQDAEFLWEQLAEFARYSFGRAHAFGYAMLAYWTAWFKVHYPIEFFTAVLSTVKQDRIPQFIEEARRFGFKVLPPDINESGRGFSAVELGVRYGIDSLKGIGEAALETILPGQPYSSFEDFRERSGAKSDVTRTLVRIGAFDSLGENRRGLETLLEAEKSGAAARCVFKTGEGTDPVSCCSYDWSKEPPRINERTGKVLPLKPVPKRCTRACRQYQAPEPVKPQSVEPYTDADIREIEVEIIGLELSSTVFDQIEDAEDRAVLIREAEEIEFGPEREYIVAAVVRKVRPHTDRAGGQMGFIGLVTERSDLDVVVFKKEWAKYRANLKRGSLVLASVYKSDRGLSLRGLDPIL